MVKELITMNMPIEDIYHDYKLVADSITDDESFQKADTGILLSHLYDIVKALEKQIPKEPEHKYITGTDDKIGFYCCSLCDYRPLYVNMKYCIKCGQAIKWE